MPALRVGFTRRAARQVEAAASWWAQNRSAAPEALKEDLAAALTLIVSQPACGTPVASLRSPDVRRIHLVRVGYHLYYRVNTRAGGEIEVVAFWHARRKTGPRL